MDVARDKRESAGRFAGTSAAGLVALVAGGLGLAALAWGLSGPIDDLDRAVAAAVNARVAPLPGLVATLRAITDVGSDLTAVLVLGTLTLVLLIRGRRRPALYVVVAGAGGAVLSPALKELVGRLRPVVDAPIATAPGPSFPSGHTMTVTLWVGIVLLALLPAIPARARRASVAAGVVVVVLVGLTRIGLGVHYLSDVVAGWLLAAAWLAMTAAAFRTWLPSGVPTPGSGLGATSAAALTPGPDNALDGSPWTCAARLLIVAVLLLSVILGAGWVVTASTVSEGIEVFDVAVVRWFAENRTAGFDAVSTPVAELGNTTVVIVLGAVAATLGIAVLRHIRPLVLLAVVLVGELLLFIAAAGIVNRPRPPVPHLDAELPPTASFPSGHTGAALCLYGAVAVLVLGATRAWWRWLVVAAAVVVVALVAVARLYRGAHHPSDVLGSVLLGLPWLLASAHFLHAGPADTTGAPRQFLARSD